GSSAGGVGGSSAEGVGGSSAGSAGASGHGGSTMTADLPPRCGFRPTPPKPKEFILGVTSRRIWTRAHEVILGIGVDVPPATDLPEVPTTQWANQVVAELLAAPKGASPTKRGLVDFVLRYTEEPFFEPELPSAAYWAERMASNGATLGTLIAAPSPASMTGQTGIFTDAELLKRHPSIGSRGSWLMKSLFCRVVPLPPFDHPPVLPAAPTRRQAHEAVIPPGSICAACHRPIDPLGFSLEHFDEHGVYREAENGFPVDSTGSFASSGVELVFTSFADLAPKLAESCEVAHCFAESWLKDVITFGVSDVPFDSPSEAEVNQIANAFADSGFSILELARAMVVSPALLR
ncbi:MAG TPA: DUF1588 domain-containing protein, partial [Polyangiaceae bacterium]|nr:DUF1588 domain-containing protein [Polyangiaceae bacterium]